MMSVLVMMVVTFRIRAGLLESRRPGGGMRTLPFRLMKPAWSVSSHMYPLYDPLLAPSYDPSSNRLVSRSVASNQGSVKRRELAVWVYASLPLLVLLELIALAAFGDVGR